MKKIVVTGSSGLIGSEVCRYFDDIGWEVQGIDNNARSVFFGPMGDTRWNQMQLQKELQHFEHNELDIRDRKGISQLLKKLRPNAIVHSAAQPSHDLAAQIPYEDFDTNAVGTLNLLEATRQHAPEAVFVHMSTNKVYGDGPNNMPLIEKEKRWDFSRPSDLNGIKEDFPIDRSKHSLFGASKVAADIMVQEYGRYFGMPTCCLRGGCLTGPNHSGVQLHGFLSYLIRCNLAGEKYTIFGYKGKQVWDNIHSFDVARFIHEFIMAPRGAEVYNLGGGRENSCSILESFELIESISRKRMVYEYSEKAREGDHICYISNLEKMKQHYPDWGISKDLNTIFREIYSAWEKRLSEN